MCHRTVGSTRARADRGRDARVAGQLHEQELDPDRVQHLRSPRRIDLMTQRANLVSMKPWTKETLTARLLELTTGDIDNARVALRRRILLVATEHFAKFGYRRTNIGDIARDSGVGKGTIYLCFDSKQTLLVAAIAFEKMAIMGDFELLTALEGEARLAAFITSGVRFALQSQLTGKLMRGDPEFERVIETYRSAHVDEEQRSLMMLDDIIGEAAPHLSPEQVLLRRNVLRAAMHSAAHLVAAPGFAEQHQEPFIETYAAFLLRGVVAS
jgi:AcrR family transcriptional regulator